MFDFNIPTKITLGTGILNRVGEIVKEYGERVFLVSDAVTMQETGYLSKIKKLIEDEGLGVLPFYKVYSDSHSDVVNKGADQARHAKCDIVIGFGGKTTLNAAKAIAHLISNDGNLEDYFLGKKNDKKKIKYIEIPSTHGFLPGVNNSFYVLDKFDRIKKCVEHRNNYADLILIDPKVTTTLPIKHSAAIGLELLTVSIEAYISKAATPIAEAFSLRAIELLGSNLVKSVQDAENINFRSILCTCGVLGSLSLANSTFGTSMSLALALNSVYGVYQSMVCAILLPHVMEFNLTSSANRYVQIAKAFGEAVSDITVVEAAIKAIEFVRKLLFDLKVPTKLSELDIDKEQLEKVSKIARNYEFLHYLPRPVSKEDLYNILIAAY